MKTTRRSFLALLSASILCFASSVSAASKFVWSGATGANDGSSWADAYTSLGRDWGAEAGFTLATDFVYVRSVHAESSSTATITIVGSTAEGTEAPVRILSVVGGTTGTDPGNLAAGASVTSTGVHDISIAERLYVYGVQFFSGDFIMLTASPDNDIVLEECRFELTSASGLDAISFGNQASVGNKFRLINSNFAFGHVDQEIDIDAVLFEWIGGTVEDNLTILLDIGGGESAFVRLVGLDLSLVQGTVFNPTNSSSLMRIERCLMHASATFVGTLAVPGMVVEAFHCQAGTDADPAYQMQRDTSRGRVSTLATAYRTGGASDGERTNPIAWDMDTTVGSVRGYPGHALESPPIIGWTDGDGSTAHTYRIYFASGDTQQDDDVWFELIGPNDGATNSLGVTRSTRVAPRGTPANYASDGVSSWTHGTATEVDTPQYMEITYTPDKPGPISAVVHMATDNGSTGHIYLDPTIYVDDAVPERAFVVPGYGLFHEDAATPGGSGGVIGGGNKRGGKQ